MRPPAERLLHAGDSRMPRFFGQSVPAVKFVPDDTPDLDHTVAKAVQEFAGLDTVGVVFAESFIPELCEQRGVVPSRRPGGKNEPLSRTEVPAPGRVAHCPPDRGPAP